MSDNKIHKGQGYKAQLEFYSCKGSGECIPVCPNESLKMVPVSQVGGKKIQLNKKQKR